MTLVFLLLAALAVSLSIGMLARLPGRQLVLQTLGMFGGVLVLYGLVMLLA